MPIVSERALLRVAMTALTGMQQIMYARAMRMVELRAGIDSGLAVYFDDPREFSRVVKYSDTSRLVVGAGVLVEFPGKPIRGVVGAGDASVS